MVSRIRRLAAPLPSANVLTIIRQDEKHNKISYLTIFQEKSGTADNTCDHLNSVPIRIQFGPFKLCSDIWWWRASDDDVLNQSSFIWNYIGFIWEKRLYSRFWTEIENLHVQSSHGLTYFWFSFPLLLIWNPFSTLSNFNALVWRGITHFSGLNLNFHILCRLNFGSRSRHVLPFGLTHGRRRSWQISLPIGNICHDCATTRADMRDSAVCNITKDRRWERSPQCGHRADWTHG